MDLDEAEREASHISSDSEDGGVQLSEHDGEDVPMQGLEHTENAQEPRSRPGWMAQAKSNSDSSDINGSVGSENESGNAIFDRQPYVHSNSNSSISSAPPLASGDVRNLHEERHSSSRPFGPSIEVEAVISCTSDGLVVIIRAVPYAPPLVASPYANGVFAAPWGANPIIPQNNFTSVDLKGPRADDFMSSIREVAVFAWALTGINGNIASYSRGTPREEALPSEGFPIWDPQQRNNHDLGPENQAVMKWAQRQKIEPPTLPLHLPFQLSKQKRRFANKKTVHSNSTTIPLPPAAMSTEDGHVDHTTQYEPAQHQDVPLEMTTRVEQNQLDLYLPTSSNEQHQGSGGGSNSVRYMWY
jgi:hypothetical protein